MLLADGSSTGAPHIDGAAIWRMLLKRRRRQIRCRFAVSNQMVRLPACGFLYKYSNLSETTALNCTVFELRAWDGESDGS